MTAETAHVLSTSVSDIMEWDVERLERFHALARRIAEARGL